MKIIPYFIAAFFLLASQSSNAESPNAIKENLKAEFPTLWNAVKKTLADMNCRIEVEKNDQGSDNLFKGNIRTEFYVLSTGVDSTKDVMERYSCEEKNCEQFPFIRGGEWSSGRVQYKLLLKEKEDNTVEFRLEGELSGFEQWVTHKVHFWDSNGMLERQLFEKIKINAGLAETGSHQNEPPKSDENKE